MAFIFKNPNTKNWLAGFRNLSGKRCNRSTKLPATEQNRRQALRIAEEFEAAANRKRTAQHVRRVISELHKSISGEDMPVVSLCDHVESWRKARAATVSPATAVTYKQAGESFIKFLGENKAGDDIAMITREEVEAFRDDLSARRAPATANKLLKVLRMVFNDARDRSLIVDDPTEFVRPVKKGASVKRHPFTVGEVHKVLEHCTGEWRSMVLIAFYTGQRLGDIARLRWDCFDLEKGTFQIETVKTRKKLSLPLHPDMLRELRELPRPINGNLHLHPETNAIVETQEGRVGTLSNQFARILVDAGLRESASHQRKGKGRDSKRGESTLSFHSLRATAASMLHEAGVAPSTVMELIGHDSAAVHQGYVSVGGDALRQGIASLPSVIGGKK